MRPRTLTRLAPLAASLSVFAPGVAANPLDMYGFGARHLSLASATTASTRDLASNYANPAGLRGLSGFRAEVGYFFANPSLRTDGRDNAVDPSHGIVGGLGAPGRLFGLPFAFGIGFHLPDNQLSQVRAIPQSQPRWELYSVRMQRLYIAANVAISPTRWMRLGVGLAFMASTRGGLGIEGQIVATGASGSQLRHTVDADLTAVRYLQAGAQFDLPRRLTLGVTFRDEFRLDTRLDAALTGQIVVGALSNPTALRIPGYYGLRSRTLTAFQPRQVVVGLAWRPTPRWLVELDLGWVQWSRYENPTASTEVTLELAIPPGLGTLRQPTVPQPALREAMRFSDRIVPRIGAEYLMPLGQHTLALRGGYHYDPSPVPAQAGVTNFIDASRHVVALGLGLSLRGLGRLIPGRLGLDLGASLQVLPERVVSKADPNDPVGDYRVGGTALTLASTLSLELE
ncbi:MAG: outer membrane protein transport protein [Myxococcales bacterium]|nr:outer membrane protein transport protein [Myxococcales bacterium]